MKSPFPETALPPAMRWRFTDDVDQFDGEVGELLRIDPVRHTVPLTTLAAIRAGQYPQRLLGWCRAGPHLAAVVLTPPHELVLAALPEPALDPLVEALRGRHQLLPGVVGETRCAAQFAAVWARRTGSRVGLGHAQRLYVLAKLQSPAPPAGGARPATPADASTLTEWMEAFDAEAGTHSPDPDRWVDSLVQETRALIWADSGGQQVSLAAVSPAIAGMVRVGPVYTPPQHRRHGYAAALTAAVCRRATEHGIEHLVLSTDLANPTSNGIYQRIGFSAVEDRLRLEFAPPKPPTG